MKCPKCGKEISNDSQFCEYCGTQLGSAKNVAGRGTVHVRWFLFVTTLLLCCMNVSLFYGMFEKSIFNEYSYFDVSTLWIVPILLLLLFIVSLILSIKKKLKAIYTILVFLILGINTAIPVYAEDNKYSTEKYRVQINLYENDNCKVGGRTESFYRISDAQEFVQMFNDIAQSSKYKKYKKSHAYYYDERYYVNSINTESFTIVLWFAEVLVLLLWLIIASVAGRKEKKSNC